MRPLRPFVEACPTRRRGGGVAGLGDLDRIDREIVRLLLAGEPNKVIARRLDIPLGTVKWRLHRLYARVGVTSRVQFAMKVRDPGDG